MKACALLLGFAIASAAAQAQPDVLAQARQLERGGESAKAELLLREAASATDAAPSVLAAYAEFLDSRGHPGARAAYEKYLAALPSASREQRQSALQRLVLLSIGAGDRGAASRYLEQYREAGGGEWAGVPAPPPLARREPQPVISIPGPLVSFKRMAAISQDTEPEELLLDLARSVVVNGYRAGGRQEGLEPTEFLKLLTRYLSQARELERLAGDEKAIRIETCESEKTGDLLRILGYRMRGGCGSEVVLETVNATRAFLTIDSGFPLAELEQALRTNRPFTYDYRPSLIPIQYGPEYWLGSRDKQEGEFIEAFIGDPSLGRFYLAMSKPDPETAEELRKAIPAQRLKAFAHVLDFYGSMFQIRNGRAVVPGGSRSERTWQELVGAAPEQGAAFFERLISRDDGWLASYFDALSRISGPVRDYLTEPERLKRFYAAIRGRVTSPGPARPVFRANTDMLLLTTRLRLEPDGRPHVPGGIAVWSALFAKQPQGRYDAKLTRLAKDWREPDDVIEALFALCRRSLDNEPLKMYMALSDMNRQRQKPLEAATVSRLIQDYRKLNSQYAVLNEAPGVTDATILRFLNFASQTDRIRDVLLRADTLGSFQGLLGLWQIFCRQAAISGAEADSTLAGLIGLFEPVQSSRQLFEAGRAGVNLLLKASGAAPGGVQEQLLNLLAGGAHASPEVRDQVVSQMQSYLEAQRTVSLTLLFEAADHLDSLGRGEKPNAALLNRVTSRLSEIALARSGLSTPERNTMVFGYWPERHIARQRNLNLRALVEKAGGDPQRLREILTNLTPLLRDTLVAFNYAYYAPPGAELLRTNPLFVRSHDFVGLQGVNLSWQATHLYGSGWPSSGGGRLVGSLAGLPYALAESEQNFLVPTREQALIWGDLVPQIILSAKVPRWWNVSPSQMHWLALHVRYGKDLLAESALDPSRRSRVLETLSEQAVPARVHAVDVSLQEGDVEGALKKVTPSELFWLARRFAERTQGPPSPIARKIRELAAEAPSQINYDAISRAFGTPKPTLTSSYAPEMLNLRTFPTLMGYSSRILAESWESNGIYFGALADELLLPPARLNVLVPEWTQRTIERIFATHLEDWPSVLRSLRQVGEEARLEMRREQQQASAGSSLQIAQGERQ